MTNYNEKITKETTKEELQEIFENHSNDINDNIECMLTMSAVNVALNEINKGLENDFYNDFIHTLETADRKTAFKNLIETPFYIQYVVEENNNGTFKFSDDKKVLCKLEKLEKAYQFSKSTETDKDGKPIRNKSVTIFSALRVYGLTECFVRNLFIDGIKTDGIKYDLTRIKLTEDTSFTAKDGECFARNSRTALNEQLNVIVKFFGLDVTMRKSDLLPLKFKIAKVKQDRETAKFSIKEEKTVKILDVIFGLICSRINNENVKIYSIEEDENGKKKYVEIKATETETETK